MLVYFKSRNHLRGYTGTKGKKVDLGNKHPSGKRWALDLSAKANTTKC